jgi:hypothetical protein
MLTRLDNLITYHNNIVFMTMYAYCHALLSKFSVMTMVGAVTIRQFLQLLLNETKAQKGERKQGMKTRETSLLPTFPLFVFVCS